MFDSCLTTYARLARLNQMGIAFMTLRRRTAALLQVVADLPASTWRLVTLEVPACKLKQPRVFEQAISLAGATLLQLFVVDLGHEQPTIMLANDRNSSHAKLLTRCAQRMQIENAPSSVVGMRVNCNMSLLVIASGLCRLLARRMRGYADARPAKSSAASSTRPPVSPGSTTAPTCPSSWSPVYSTPR